jgi:hypothetical protein
LKSCIQHASTNGCLTSFHLRNGSHSPRSRARYRCSRGRIHRRIKRGAGLHAELAHKEFAADSGLARRTYAITGSGQAPHQKHLVILIHGILSHK